jgi:RNA polymerase sigma-70 factor, ECF subfamily
MGSVLSREIVEPGILAQYRFPAASASSSHRSAGEAQGPSDQKLMEGIRDGSHASMQTLLRRYWGPLVSYASRFSERRDEAEDVVQETFVRIWSTRSKWTASGAVGAYLFRITQNVALNALRDRKAQQSRERRSGEDIVSASSWRTPAEDFEATSFRHEVEEAIGRLPKRRREVLVLSRFHGLTHQEIADTMGLSRQTVANHMMSALTNLRSTLSCRLGEH